MLCLNRSEWCSLVDQRAPGSSPLNGQVGGDSADGQVLMYVSGVTYPLLTARLEIFPLDDRDAEAFVRYRQDEDIARWQGWDPTYAISDATELIAAQPVADLPVDGGWFQLAIRDRHTATLLGEAAIHCLDELADTYEIGITLASTSQHRGVASEADKRILNHLFTTGNAHRVTANCDARNIAVARLVVGAGMRQESRQFDLEFFKGEWITLEGYAILKSEHLDRG
ncbi:MAG: ribosomal-protein-serine acetyltransferase [Glaciihabitans sp.]|nr:ribosomal-protein-serine acetyltransferase [Glaciihabitans sp.]